MDIRKELPDTSQAERWLDADTFVVKGKVYRIEPDGEVLEIVNERDI